MVGCRAESGAPILTWYINPDNGAQARLAAACTARAADRYRIRLALLPRDSTAQREQLVRRLAASDTGIDLLSLDVPYLAEFAHAGFIRRFPESERGQLTAGMLDGPLASAIWAGALYAVPFNTNTQLLWYRKSVAARAGLDIRPDTRLTWGQVIDAAERTRTTVQVQAARYEGYTVLINSLVASAGGAILRNPEAGRAAASALGGSAGERAAEVLRSLAGSAAAPADLNTSTEGTAQAGFLTQSGGFMVNWPFVYTAETTAISELEGQRAAAATDAARHAFRRAIADRRARIDDLGWARWPAVLPGRQSAPPLGGINLAIGAFTKYPGEAVEAVRCLTSRESQKIYMLHEGLLSTIRSNYEDADIRKAFPMADLLRQSVAEAAPRPITPYYPDITGAIQRTWHPPTAVTSQTPREAADFIRDVLQDRRLL